MKFEREYEEKYYDFVVVGGGISGVCAAIAAARNGCKTALVQDRPVLGGNASSEIRVLINGASRHRPERNDFQETGLVLEMLLRSKKINPFCSYSVFDHVLWQMTEDEKLLDLYLNTRVGQVLMEQGGNRIQAVLGIQTSTDRAFAFFADQFADTTGDAVLVAESGGEWREGREARSEYNESAAPEKADSYTMGSTIVFTTRDMGHPVPFHRPDWAYPFTREMLGRRDLTQTRFGYWWIEVGGDELRVIEDAEDIRDELVKYVYGVFDYIKNCGDYQADNLVLDWIGTVPGKRESRRCIGDYVLTQDDVAGNVRFADAVAYGGWTMDNHIPGGIKGELSMDEEGSRWIMFSDVYTIPYRCLYSRNIDNLLVGGRAISATHQAMSSSRVIATCGICGQAIGTAAALLHKKGMRSSRELLSCIGELQQNLLRDDCYIPGIPTRDDSNLIRSRDCTITASGFLPGREPSGICSDYARRVGDQENIWISQPMAEAPAWLTVSFPEEQKIGKVILRFDPDFGVYVGPTQDIEEIRRMPAEMPVTLVRDYTLSFLRKGEVVQTVPVQENYLRMNVLTLPEQISCDCIRIDIARTYGAPSAGIFEVQAYT